MRRSWLAPTLLVLVAILLQPAPANADDIARVMPRDTAFYIGWSQWLAKDSPELAASQKYLTAARSAVSESAFAKDQTGEGNSELLSKLFDVLPLLQTGSAGIGLFDVTIEDGQPNIQAALVVDAGADSGRLTETLRSFLAQAADENKIQRRVVKDVSLESLQLGEGPLYVVWGVCEHRFILAIGDAAAGKVIDCIANRAPNLADAEELKFDREKVKAQASGRHACLYVDLQRVLTRAKEIATQQMGELPPTVEPALVECGLTAVKSKYVHIDQQDGQPRCTAFAHVDGPLKGLLKIWDQKPLTDDDVKIVPKDAYWAEIGNLSLARLWEEALRILEALAPDRVPMVEGALAMPTSMLGFSITDDLLPAFGDTWAIFDAPEHGGFLLSGTVFAAEVKNPEALQGMLTRVVQLATPIAAQKNAALKLKQLEHGGHTIHYVLVAGVPSPVAPAWGFTGDRCVFGLFPQTVATALKQADTKTRGESLLDNPDFQAARARLPKDAQSVGYFDSKYFTRMFYPFLTALQTLGTSMIAKQGADVDLTLMPPLPEMAAKVTNYVGTTSTDKDGILYAGVGSGAQPLMVAVGGTAMATSILLPSLARAREITKRAVSASNLRGLGQACLIYANDHADKFPDSLQQLVDDGVAAQKQLRSPRDEDQDEDTVSFVYIAGQTTAADPRNVLAYERVFGDEGTNVLFMDGHVEWMKLDNFKKAVRETYQRLGRELPADFDQNSSTSARSPAEIERLRKLGYAR